MNVALTQQPSPLFRPAQQPAEQAPSQHTDATAPNNCAEPTAAAASPLQAQLADNDNLRLLAAKLVGLDTRVYGKPVSPERVSYLLNTDTMTPVKGSSYAATQSTPATLAAAITALGFKLPTTIDEVAALRTALEQKAPLHPLGNLGGGLSWPIPMSQEDQRSIVKHLDAQKPQVKADESLPEAGASMGALAYLLSGSAVMPSDLQDPVGALQKLLDSPKAGELGRTLQAQLKGAPSSLGVYDYVLTAIHLGLDPESLEAPTRTTVAGFDLAKPEYWGRSPSKVVEHLNKHLVDKGRATADSVKLASHLLLARTAPQYLIKDIPASVTIGSLAWANLSIAVAAIEAERPGTVANMTFVEVMNYAAQYTPAPIAPESAKSAVLVEWGIANGLLEKNATDAYTPEQINQLRATFTQRSTALLSATKALDAEILTRKDIALIRLKELFGDLGPLFEEKIFTSTDERLNDHWQRRLGGTLTAHSLLDIAMMDLSAPWPRYQSRDSRIPIKKVNSSLAEFNVLKSFETWFGTTLQNKKEAVNTTVRHLISQLPLEDRQNFEYGKITLYQETTEKLGIELWGTSPGPTSSELLVKIERDGKTHTYEIDFNNGIIQHTDASRTEKARPRGRNLVYVIKELKPYDIRSGLDRERPSNGQPLDNFSSARSYSIGNLLVEHLGLNRPSIKEAALEQTTLDAVKDRYKPLNEFLLNLIPLRSAIVNFKKGNIGEGLFDLTLDVFGFLTAGVAAGGKLLKIGQSALSAGTKALQGAKVIGVATLGALNPLAGVDDLAKGGLKLLDAGAELALRKVRESFNKLKGASGSYDLLKAASKQHELAATGTYQVAGHSVSGGAVLNDGKWYAFDADKMRPYGAPLSGFVPDAVAKDGAVKAVGDELLSWVGSKVWRTQPTENLASKVRTAITDAKASDEVAFARGYASGTTDGINGYFSSMNLEQLKELVISGKKAPEEIGSLLRAIEKKRIEVSRRNFEIFSSEVKAAGGTIQGMPQGFYLSQTDVLSEGECAVLANAMALAMEEDRVNKLNKVNKVDNVDNLFNNFFVSISDMSNPRSIKFRNDLTYFQGVLENQVHGLRTPELATHDTIGGRKN